MAKRFNLAFLGCGRISAAHGRTLSAFSRDVRCFYASRDAHRAMEYERRLGGSGSFGSYSAALADGRMDVAFVATPPATHLALVLEALDRGRDVIVEKPAFLRIADYDTVARASERVGRRVLVAENYCYKPLARVLRGLLAAGVVGSTLLVQINALKRQPTSGWRDDETQGGGALVEGGIHWVDLMAHLGPALRSVRGYRAGGNGAVERSTLVVVEYEDGSIGTLAHSWEAPSLTRGLQLSRIQGREGSIVFESNGLFVAVNGHNRRLILPGLRDIAGYRAMFRDFIRALRTGEPPLMTLERAREDAALVLSALGGGAHGSRDGRGDRCVRGGAHLDVGDVQGQPA